MNFTIIFYTSLICLNCANYATTVQRAIQAAGVDNCCEFTQVDITENPPVTTRGLQTIPTVIIVDQMAVEQSRITGYQSVVKIVEWIRYTTEY